MEIAQFGSTPYDPGRLAERPAPLARFMPPVPAGVVTHWLQTNVPPGSIVLDPFGTLPSLPVEAARAGYRVLVAASNPIARFLLETAASPPDADDLQVALADLAASRKGDQRLEPLMQSLYATSCANCGRTVTAQAFIWDREEDELVARVYSCPHCGDHGERPVAEEDLVNASRVSARGLHMAWALERVAPLKDPDRPLAEEALEVYLPRAVYALFTLINKLDGLPTTPERRRLLTALLISACDRANNLWTYPSGRERPRQLSTPPRHFEYNVWQALEDGVQDWSQPDPAVPLTYWPQHPQPGGISLFEGRLKDLAADLEQLNPAGILMSLPRPNQAYWTLSAIWSAWLWGRESLGPFASVIRRRRYDWAWHTTALHAAFSRLAPQIAPGTPMLGLSSEAEPGMFSAAMTAAQLTGFDLTGLAFRRETGQAQITWTRRSGPQGVDTRDPETIVQEAARDVLVQRGEPGHYMYLHAAAMAALAQTGCLDNLASTPAEIHTAAQDITQKGLSYRRGFLRFEGSPHSLEVGRWWLTDPDKAAPPLSDRVEETFCTLLQDNPGCDIPELDAALCARFPGLLTPSSRLLEACLESYGKAVDETDRWELRPEDLPETRQNDQEEVSRLLTQIGARLGYQSEGQIPLMWMDERGRPAFSFYILTTAAIGKVLLSHPHAPQTAFLVLPGSRANLVLFKQRRDPRLEKIINEGWRFLKFRHLRRLSESPLLNRENLDDQFALDPLTYTQPQIALL